MYSAAKSWVFQHRKPLMAGISGYCALLSLVILLSAFGMPTASEEALRNEAVFLQEGWTVLEDGKLVGENVSLPYTPTSRCKEVELRLTLPATPFSSAILITTVFQNNFQVFLGEESLYSYVFQPQGLEQQTPGSGRFFVRLPEHFSGQELRLVYGRMVFREHSAISPVSLYNDIVDPYLFLPGSNVLLFLMIAIFLIGMALLLVSCLLDGRKLIQSPLFHLAAFAITTSVWVLCNTKLIQLFTNNLVFIHDLEYISFYLMPSTLWLFAWTNWHYCPRVTLPLITTMSGFASLTLTLKVLGLLDFFALLPIFHLLVLGNLVVFIASIITAPPPKDFSLRMFFLGFGMLSLCAFIDIMRYYFFYSHEVIFSFFILGVLLLATCTMISYLYALRLRIQQQTENRMYKALAYTDRLTGLRNRLTFDEDLAMVEANQDKYVSIILVSLDVNSFKHINDAYGHMKGDEVLRLIGELLNSLCNENRKCYRMGGDEFYIIALNNTVSAVTGLMERLNAELYHAIMEFPVSVSFGVAEHNRFLHSSLTEVLKSADDVMYRNKRSLRRRASDRDSGR